MKSLVVVLAAFTLVSCSRDPNIAKKRYLENGNKYFAKGKYREASIMYRNALQKDQRFGLAYYHLALTDLKLGRIPNALGELRRAIELIPKDQPEHIDSQIKLAEIYIAYSREPSFLNEVETITTELLARDPDSYDGHRLAADLDFVRAQISYRADQPAESQKLLKDAIAEYRKAASIKAPTPNLTTQLARALASNRQFDEAEKLYRQLIDRDKTLVQAYTELYSLYLLQNKTAEAEQILKSGAANNPKQVNFLVALATFYSNQKRRDDMIAALNQIKQHAKEFDRAYLVVGDFYFRNGELDEAYRQYKEGIAADSKQKATYQKRMIEILMRQNRRTEAADIDAAILKDNPKDSDARGLQATLLLDRGEVQKAISELQSVVNASSDNFVARFNLGRAHVARGEWEQARQQFTEAIRLRPDYLPARLALAQLQIMRGEYDAALKTVGEILQIDRKNTPARMLEAAALLHQDKFAAARQLLDGMKQENPNSVDIDFSLGMVSLKEGKLKEAEQIFRKAYADNPKDPRSVVGLVQTLTVGGHYDQAVAFLRGELAKSPDRNDLHMALGNIAFQGGDFDLSLSEFQKVLASMPPNSKSIGQVYLRMGEVYRRKGDLNNAANALQNARAALPENSLVINELALTLDGSGRKSEARQAYDQAIRMDPQNGIALNNLAMLMADNGGDLDQALTYAQRAKQIMPNLAEISDTLGWIYLKKNMSDNALDLFHDLVAKVPSNSTYRYHLGMALAQKGDRPAAIKELEKALENSPGKDEQTKIKDLINKLQA